MHARFIGRTGVRLAASLAVLATVATAGIGPASAATASVPVRTTPDNCGISQLSYYYGNTCAGGLLLFYHSDGAGATASLVGGASNLSHDPVYAYNGSTLMLDYYADYIFVGMQTGDTSGSGQGIRNNVGSVENYSSSESYTLYVSPGFTGAAQTIGPNDFENLDSQLDNNEASVVES